MRDRERKAELGRFLRARRLELQPEAVGIKPNLGRRRTPGLRREEVAERAAISVSWYTWLEQGRDIHVSEAVLDSIGECLQLDATEREYLHSLARSNGPVHPRSGSGVPASVHRILTSQ